MKTDFIPIDYDYFDFQGRNFAMVIGRNSHGKRVCVIDSCDVYFWAILKDGLKDRETKKIVGKIEKIELDSKGRNTKVERVEIHDKSFLGKKVKALKVFATNYKDMHDVADKMGFKEIEKRRGYDLGYITHYIMEKKLVPMSWYEVTGEILSNSEEFGGIDSGLDVDMCIKAEKISKIEGMDFSPKALAYDIEADEMKIGSGEILMVSLFSGNFRKVITWKHKKPIELGENVPVEYVKNEGELLESFVNNVRKISPDFLVGYFSDGFDLPYLKARAEKHGVSLSLGLDGSQPRFSRGGFAGNMTGRIKGIVHLDILKFIKTAYSQYMQSETLSLNEVANEFLGERKKDFEFRHSSKIKEDEWERYFEYNLHDSALAFGLFGKIFRDMAEFSRIMSEPIFEVSRNGMSKNVESYIIHNLEKFNEIPEKRPTYNEIGERRQREKYEGAFVLEPVPGIYDDVAIFDFTSSYGSVIVTYNLSKSTFLEKREKKAHSIFSGGKELFFSKEPGFFPEMLRDIIEKRKKYKQELKSRPDSIKEARSNAFKLLANASYGYQGFFGARYYCMEAAAATAAFAKKSIKDAIEKINARGYRTIYSDTDSIAFLMNGKTKSDTVEFLKSLNSDLPGIMELELEDFYRRGIWVTKRSGEIGAKKKYALINEKGKLKIRGFETVRRDWCGLARKLQNEVLRHVLDEGNEKKALEHVKQIVKGIRHRKIPLDELIIKTQLKKSISDYVSISPHVIAARKMMERKIPAGEGELISYYVAESKEKKKLVRERVKLPDEKGEYDVEYYLKHQILPAVENIFQVFGVDVNEIIDGKKQNKLSKWM